MSGKNEILTKIFYRGLENQVFCEVGLLMSNGNESPVSDSVIKVKYTGHLDPKLFTDRSGANSFTFPPYQTSLSSPTK